MPKFDYLSSKGMADALIRKYGMKASLRRSGVDRDCFIVVVAYNPRDAQSSLTNPTDRKVIMSALSLDVPPDNEQDMLVTYVQPPADVPVVDEILPFTCPVKQTSPAGTVVVYEFTVRR